MHKSFAMPASHPSSPGITMSRSARIALLALASAGFAFVSSAQAQVSYAVGQQLSQAQLQALNTLKTIDVGGSTYRVLQTGQSSAGLPFTMLLDTNGAVGQTYHELLIAEQPTDKVRAQLGSLASQAAAVNFHEQAQLTVLRFETLDKAVAALAQAKAALPDAEIGIPIAFTRPASR